LEKTGIFLHDWTLKHETLEQYCTVKDAIEKGSECGDSFIETLTKCAIRMLELQEENEKYEILLKEKMKRILELEAIIESRGM